MKQYAFLLGIIASVISLGAYGEPPREASEVPKPQITDANVIPTLLTSKDMALQRQAFDRLYASPEKFARSLLQALQKEVVRVREKKSDIKRLDRLLCLTAVVKSRDIGFFLLGVLSRGECELTFGCIYFCPIIFSITIHTRFVEPALAQCLEVGDDTCSGGIMGEIEYIGDGILEVGQEILPRGPDFDAPVASANMLTEEELIKQIGLSNQDYIEREVAAYVLYVKTSSSACLRDLYWLAYEEEFSKNVVEEFEIRCALYLAIYKAERLREMGK